ncbi:MAG: hypothetical protein AAFP08_05840 [Bacteroidota bacterium]
MMIRIKAFLLFAGTFIGLSSALYAQPGGLPSGEVDVIRSFEANLIEAERVGVNPVLPPPDTTVRRQQYNVVARPLNMDYPAPVIRPRAIGRERTDDNYNGLLSLGVGWPLGFYGDLSYDIVNVQDFDLGFRAHRHSFNNNAQVENQRASDTRLGLDGTYYFDQGFAVTGELGYTGQTRHYYGYNFPEAEDDSIPSFEANEVRQRFTTIDLAASIFNGTRTEGDFDYSAGFDFYLFDALGATRETGFAVDIQATKWFGDRDPLDIRLRTDVTNYRDTSRQNLNNFYLQPSYTAHFDRFKLRIGANLVNHNDEFFIYPDLEATVNIIPGIVSAFLGATGDLQKNTFRSLAEYNPWIRTRLEIANSDYNRFYGGVEGTLYGLAYRAEVGLKEIEGLPLYLLNRRTELPTFDVVFDTASIVSIQASLTIPLVENLDLTAGFIQNIYSLDNQDRPWHLPSTTLNATGIYTVPNSGLQVRADVFLENGLPTQNADGTARNLNALFDISLGAEYNLSDQLSLWGQLNNLANNQRQRFARYPTLGINVLAGVSVKF